MKVIVFSTKRYDREFLEARNAGRHSLIFTETPLSESSAQLAQGCNAACVFVNDDASETSLRRLSSMGVKLLALRCSGFNNVDLRVAQQLGIKVARVPAYSPHSVAEHTLALMLALNRSLHRAYNRVREGNFSLEGLLGFDLHGKTVGIVGTGTIGTEVARILTGFGCTILATDPVRSPACLALGARYVGFDELCSRSNVITLHCPLTPATHHLIDAKAIATMRTGVMLINTSRGAVVDTRALIAGLKSRSIGSVALDVYEEEAHLFFDDLSNRILDDDVFARLLTFPNVIITGHQAFFTTEALTNIADVTLANLTTFESTGSPIHEISVEKLAPPTTS